MTTASRTHTRRSRGSRTPAANLDRAAKALATAETIRQRVHSLVAHLAHLSPQELDTVAEPVLKLLSAAVADIHELHTLFAGWAADNTDPADPSDLPPSDDQPAATPGGGIPALHSARTPTTADPARHSNTDARHLHAAEPAGPGHTPDPGQQPGSSGGEPPSGQPLTGPCRDDTGDHLVQAASTGHEPGGDDRQPACLHTAADLAQALRAIPEDAPIHVQHDGKTYTLCMRSADGQLVLHLAGSQLAPADTSFAS
jgi:hypothetical protein